MRVIIYLISSWVFGEIFVGKKYGEGVVLIETERVPEHRFILGISFVFFFYSAGDVGS